MIRKFRGWALVAVLTLTVSFAFVGRFRGIGVLQDQVIREQALHGRLRARAADIERDRLQSVAVAENAARAAAQVSLDSLRAQIQELKTRAASRLRRETVLPVEGEATPPSILHVMLPVEQWRNAGHATAPATLETALWAAANGDVEAFARLLSIDPVVRTKLNAMLMTLPESLRQEYGTPEKLIALLATDDVPLGAAKIYDPKVNDIRGTPLSVVLRDENNRVRAANLTLRQEGDGWKITVPGSAVEKYAAKLSGMASK